MPKLYEYLGIVFYFYACEHLPIHVHAKYENCETVFELIYENGELADLLQRASTGGPPKSANRRKQAEEFVRTYHKQITEKWQQFFILKTDVVAERITQRLP